MATKGKGLGKGLDTLIPSDYAPAKKSKEEQQGNSQETIVKITKVEPNREQPRKHFDEDALQELADSIKQFGLLQPILVQDRGDYYEIIAGERRWRAAKLAGLKEVPVIIRNYTNQEIVEISLIENIQREDLNPIEEAFGIQKLIEEYGFTQEEAATKLSKSRPAITNALRLLALPKDVLKSVEDGLLSAGHARTLLGLEDEEQISDIAREIVEKQLSVRQTEQLVKALKKPKKNTVKQKTRDKFYDEVELALSQTLARKVVVSNSGKGGKLEIEFFDSDDLQKIAKLFSED